MTFPDKSQFQPLFDKLYVDMKAIYDGTSTPVPEPQPEGYSFALPNTANNGFEASQEILTLDKGAVDIAKVPVGATLTLPDGSTRTVTSIGPAYGGSKTMIKFSGGIVKGMPGRVTVTAKETPNVPKPEEPVPAPSPGKREFMPGWGLGINVAGAEFGSTKPGTVNKDYVWPVAKDLKPSADEGMRLIRYPFRLERVFQSLGGAFREADMKLFDKAMDDAASLGLLMNLDAHNYFEWQGKQISDYAALAKSWAALVKRYAGHPAFESAGVMNEPKGTKGAWWEAAAVVQKAIQDANPDTNMTFCGDTYANGFGFMGKNKGIDSFEWGPRSALEIHTYFDTPHGGSYSNRAEKISPTVGVNRVKEAREYAASVGIKIVHGEFGIPWNMDQTPMETFLADCKKHDERCYAWAAGPWWSENAANGMYVKGKWREPNIQALRKFI